MQNKGDGGLITDVIVGFLSQPQVITGSFTLHGMRLLQLVSTSTVPGA